MKIVRSFDKKFNRQNSENPWTGHVGTAELELPQGPVLLNGQELPQGMAERLLGFGLQMFQDAYAGAKNLEDGVARFNEKIAKVLAGTLNMRTAGGTGFDSYLAAEIELRVKKPESVARLKAIKDAHYSDDKAENGKLKSRARMAFLEELYDAAPESFQDTVDQAAAQAREEARARSEAKAAKRAAVADGV